MLDLASILVCLPSGVGLVDPNPAESQRRGIQPVDEWDDACIGIVGWSNGGPRALAEAAKHPDVARLVLVSVPSDPETLTADPALVTAKTLLLFGSADPNTGSKHGRAWKRELPNARLEMIPGGGHELLQPMWPRILAHVAPGRLV